MKTVFFNMKYVMVLCFALFGFYACSDKTDTWTADQPESPYERIGRLHNEGLDYVLTKITSTAPRTRAGGRVIPSNNEIRTICCDFARMKGFQPVTKSMVPQQDSLEDFSFLSTGQQQWLSRIKKVVWTVTPDRVDKFIILMKNLEHQLNEDQEISEPEKEALFHVMAVCRYSAHYWAKNYEKWQVELYGANKISLSKVRTRSETHHIVTKEWWEKHKKTVWADGVGGIERDGRYYLEDATVGSVLECLNN